jgi:hypothetical protein
MLPACSDMQISKTCPSQLHRTQQLETSARAVAEASSARPWRDGFVVRAHASLGDSARQTRRARQHRPTGEGRGPRPERAEVTRRHVGCDVTSDVIDVDFCLAGGHAGCDILQATNFSTWILPSTTRTACSPTMICCKSSEQCRRFSTFCFHHSEAALTSITRPLRHTHAHTCTATQIYEWVCRRARATQVTCLKRLPPLQLSRPFRSGAGEYCQG